MPEDTPQGEEQPTMLSFTEAAERLVKDHIAPNMTAEGLRRLARDPNSGWPIGPKDYRIVGKTRTLPYDVLAPYMRERFGKRRGRGPDAKKRSRQPKQGVPVTTAQTLPDVIRTALNSVQGTHHHLPLATLDVLTDKLTADLTPYAAAQREAAIDEVVEALQSKAAELSAEAEEELRRDLEEQAQEWHRAADVAAKLKRAKAEA